MVGQICHLETIHSQKVPIKVCVIFYDTFSVSYIEAVEKKEQLLLQSLYLPKCIVVDLSIMTYQLLCCESGINQCAEQKNSTDILGDSVVT